MTSSISAFYQHITGLQIDVPQDVEDVATEATVQPPMKNSIRYKENDPSNHREKYDGHRWRLVCTWPGDECRNLAYTWKLCPKHNALRKNKPVRTSRKTKLQPKSISIPTDTCLHSGEFENDDDDIEYLGIFPTAIKMPSEDTDEMVKNEYKHFDEFAIDYEHQEIEPQASTSSILNQPIDVEYVGSTATINTIPVNDSLAKHIPPLTDFEEDYIAMQMIQNCPQRSSIIDAQLYLHRLAITVVQKNYRIKMDTINQDYFYDFLLRHPNVPLHFKHWFSHCKPTPPDTGSHIDTKIWTLSMMIRGTTLQELSDHQ